MIHIKNKNLAVGIQLCISVQLHTVLQHMILRLVQAIVAYQEECKDATSCIEVCRAMALVGSESVVAAYMGSYVAYTASSFSQEE